jgi:TetR/AcrR family transcriptional regulator, transcriptional repressor of aconitase
VPKISEEAKAERIEQILTGARRCFARHGYEGATVVRLEQEIGLSRGAIFNWFPKKEDIFLELATRDNGRVYETWVEHGVEAAIRSVLEEDPDWLGVYLGVAHRLRTDPAFRERWAARDRPEDMQRLIERMEADQTAGLLRDDLEPEQIGQYVGVICDGLVLHRAAGFDPPLDPVLQLVRDTLAPRAATSRARTRSRTPS